MWNWESKSVAALAARERKAFGDGALQKRYERLVANLPLDDDDNDSHKNFRAEAERIRSSGAYYPELPNWILVGSERIRSASKAEAEVFHTYVRQWVLANWRTNPAAERIVADSLGLTRRALKRLDKVVKHHGIEAGVILAERMRGE